MSEHDPAWGWYKRHQELEEQVARLAKEHDELLTILTQPCLRHAFLERITWLDQYEQIDALTAEEAKERTALVDLLRQAKACSQ